MPCCHLLQSMASSDMDQNQAETFLVSQTKKRDGGISEQQSKVLLQVWKMHRIRVHESMLRSCVWNDQLRNISWRIDIKSRSRAVDQLNMATAVVELELENSNAKSQVCKFALKLFALHYESTLVESCSLKHFWLGLQICWLASWLKNA